MNSFKHTIFATALVILSAGAASAAIDRNTGLPVESYAQNFSRCGVVLTNPNAIAEAAGAACTTVKVLALLEPREDAQNAE